MIPMAPTASVSAWGAEAIQELLRNIDLDKESQELKKALKDSTGQKRARIIKRLRLSRPSVNRAISRNG